MSIHLLQGATSFNIKASDKAAALAAVKALAKQTEKMSGGSGKDRYFSWVATKDFQKARKLEDALGAWRWEPETDKKGNVVGLSHTGEKLGDDDVLFEALAPFVETGSYIEATGNGDAFRWRFADGKCHVENGRLVYEGDLPEGQDLGAGQALRNIHQILHGHGPDADWNAGTLDAIAEEVAKVIPPPR